MARMTPAAWGDLRWEPMKCPEIPGLGKRCQEKWMNMLNMVYFWRVPDSNPSCYWGIGIFMKSIMVFHDVYCTKIILQSSLILFRHVLFPSPEGNSPEGMLSWSLQNRPKPWTGTGTAQVTSPDFCKKCVMLRCAIFRRPLRSSFSM